MIRAKFILPVAIFTVALAFVVGCSSEEPAAPQQPAPAAPAAEAQPAAPVSGAPSERVQPAPAAPAAQMTTMPQSPNPAQPAQRVVSYQPGSVDFGPTPVPAAEFPLTVIDGNGNEVVFDSPPERIIAWSSAVVEILYAMGEGHRVIGTHDFVDYPPETADIRRLGGAFEIDLEAAVEMEPDLVYMFYDRFNEDLDRAGLKALYIPTLSDDFPQVAERIRMWGRIVGNTEDAERVAMEFEARVQAIEDIMAPIGAGPTVFQDAGGYWTPGKGTLIQEVFELLRLENIAAEDVEGYAQISPEIIVERNPDIIISGYPEPLLEEPALANVRAIQDGAIYTPGTNALSVASPRFVEGIEELARWVYPGLFR